MVRYYPCDGDANDYSGNIKHGTAVNTDPATGRFGSAYAYRGVSGLAGASRIALPDLPQMSALSIAGWIKPDQYPSGTQPAATAVIFARRAYTTDLRLELRPDGKIAFSAGRGANTPGNAAQSIQPVPLGQWTHVLATMDGTATRIYINGTLSAETASAGALLWSGLYYGTAIGIDSDGASAIDPFSGAIDDAIVFDRVLSGAEAALLAADGNANQLADFWETVAKGINITQPLAGTYGLPTDSDTTVAWDSENAGATVKIELSTAAGAYQWQTVAAAAANVAGHNTCAWHTPAVDSSTCYLRVTSNADAAVTDTEGPFAIGSGSPLPADFNGDNQVDITDIANLLLHLNTQSGQAGYDALYDINGDGAINFLDLVWVCRYYGTSRGGVLPVYNKPGLAPATVNATLLPGRTMVAAGETIDVELRLSGDGVAAVQSALTFDGLKLAEAGWQEGAALKADGTALIQASRPSKLASQTALVALLRNPLTAIASNGTVLKFTLRVKDDAAPGVVTLAPAELVVLDSNAQKLTVTAPSQTILVVGRNAVRHWTLFE